MLPAVAGPEPIEPSPVSGGSSGGAVAGRRHGRRDVRIDPDWRADLDRRVAEAGALLGSAPGVHGLVIAGSVGRGTPWPLSDVDLLVVYGNGADPTEFERRRTLLESFWTWSFVPASLDAGTLAFSADEVRAAVDAGPSRLAGRLDQPRWLHAVDKAHGGRPAPGSPPLVAAFAELLTAARFMPDTVQARRRYWRRDVDDAVNGVDDALGRGDRRAASAALQRAVESTIELVTESWGERSISYGRRWTRFERLARRHDAVPIASRLLAIGGMRSRDVRPRLAVAPWWLQRRIDLSMAARRLVGEPVSADENARDQLLAFAGLWQRRGLPGQLWAQPRRRHDVRGALQEVVRLADGG